MAYKDTWTICNDTDFWHAVTVAAVAVCADVMAEAPATTNHANRVILMKQVLADPDMWGRRFAYAVAMLGGTGSSTDPQLKGFVASAFNAYSGVV